MSETHIVSCPNCSAAYPLTAEYLAQYGGQQTLCSQCQKPFAIPLPAPTPVSAVAGASPVPVLPYMGPAIGATPGVWRDGKLVVAAKGATLPLRCIKCNCEVDESPRGKNFRWVQPWYGLLILAGILGIIAYVIIVATTQKSGYLFYNVCRRHRMRRSFFIVGGVCTVPAAIFLFMLAGTGRNLEYLIPIGIVLLIIGLIVGMVGGRIVYPSRIDDRYVILKGAGKDFLNLLPSV